MNANEIIKSALRKLVVIPAGGTPSVNQYADGLEALNDLVASWSAEASLVYQDTREEITIAANTQNFTLGQSAADYATDAPTEVVSALLKDASGYEYPLKVIDVNTFDNIGEKTDTSVPDYLYFRNTFPNSTFLFETFTNQEYILVLTSMKALTQFPDGTTEIDLPPYYKRAFKQNLMLEVAPEMGAAKRVTPLMKEQAEESMNKVIGKSVKINVSRTELATQRRRVDGDYGGRY